VSEGKPAPPEEGLSGGEGPSRRTPDLILASASPRRLELLARLGIEPARVIHADIDESPHKEELPRDYARRMARGKAAAVVGGGGFVLAGDTVVAAGRRILPKAQDLATARRCLELLSGRRHRVLSAIALRAPDGTLRERLSETVVLCLMWTVVMADSS